MGIGRLLQHTPVRAIGLNYSSHFQLRSEESWHRVGDILTPKEFWEEFLSKPGMRRLAIESEREDDRQGYRVVTIELSMKVENGLLVDVNNHIEAPEGHPGASWIVEVIEKSWQQHIDQLQIISNRLVGLAMRGDE